MARKAFTMESNVDKIILKIQEKPKLAMGKIGGQLVREIKASTMKSQFHRRQKILTKKLEWAYGYDAAAGKKDKTSLQIGFRISIPGLIGKIMTGAEPDPIKPIVLKNADLIQRLIGAALDEIRSE
jgi:hypothetical protein